MNYTIECTGCHATEVTASDDLEALGTCSRCDGDSWIVQDQPPTETTLYTQMSILAAMLPKDLYHNGSIYQHRDGEVRAELNVQAHTQAEVERARASLPYAIWKKSYSAVTNWQYRATFNGVRVDIYACKEAPPTCKAVKKTRMVTKQVPVQDVEMKTVEVEEEYVEWDCSNGEEV